MTASPIGFDGPRHGDAVRPAARQRSGGREFEHTQRFDDVVGEARSRQEAPEHGRRAGGGDEGTSKGSRDPRIVQRDLHFLHGGRRPSGQDAGLPAGPSADTPATAPASSEIESKSLDRTKQVSGTADGEPGDVDDDRTIGETPVAEDGGWRADESSVPFVSLLAHSPVPASTAGSALSAAEGASGRADRNSGFNAKAQDGKAMEATTATDTLAAGSARNGPVNGRNTPSLAGASRPGDGSQPALSGNTPAASAQRAATVAPQLRVSMQNTDFRSQSSGVDAGRTASSGPARGSAAADRSAVTSRQSFSGAISNVRTDSQADEFATPARTVETTISETKAASKNASEHAGLVQSQSDQLRSVQSMTIAGILSKINADPAWTRALAPVKTAKPGAVPTAPTAANTLKLQLHPAHLGTVEATLRIDGDKLVIHLKVETTEAYKSLASGNDAILDKLKGHGYVVDHITVQHASADRPATSQQPASSQSFSQPQGGGEAMAGGGYRSDRQAGRDNAKSGNTPDEPPSAQSEPVSRPRPGGHGSGSVYL